MVNMHLDIPSLQDKRVQELFGKIAEYRAAGTSLPQDASMEAERNDEDDTLYVAGSPKDAVVQASPSDSTKTTPASTEKVPKVQEEFYLMEVSEEQEKELSALLAEIDALENTQKSNPKFAESSQYLIEKSRGPNTTHLPKLFWGHLEVQVQRYPHNLFLHQATGCT